MTDEQINAHRNTLANNFAAAGAELLEFMRAPGTLAAIPNTSPEQYVVAGDLVAIQALLPNRRERRGQRPKDELYFGPEAGQPRRWSILITESGKGVVADYGYRFPEASPELERVDVVEFSPAIANKATEEGDFKNFHRLLCERFGYAHDDIDWKRDQLSLIEHITADRASRQVANKAAEEGELPALPEGDEFSATRMLQNGQLAPRYTACSMRQYAMAAVLNDRASRQVANKAEVYLSTVQRFDLVGDYEGGQMMDESDTGDWVYFADIKDIATPPASTGASTVQRPTDDELWDATLRDRDTYHEWADKLADAIAKHFGVDIGEHSNQNLPWAEALEAIENAEPVGASTVLTDEQLRDTEGYKLGWMEGMSEGAELATGGEKTAADVEAEFADLLPGSYYMDPPDGGSPSVLEQISRMAEDAAKWREIAAQAGQVAVPEGWKLVPVEPTSKMMEAALGGATITPALRAITDVGLQKNWRAMLAAAPSVPAVAQQAPAQAEPFDFRAHLARQAAWSEKTFGPGPRTKGVCDHIRKELLEIEADPLDLREWIDVVILGLDGAWRCGGTPDQIIAGIVAKQTKNEGRTWPDWRTADPDKAIEHDRSKDGAQASTAGESQEGGK